MFLARRLPPLVLFAMIAGVCARPAQAAPVAAHGKATVGEFKKDPSVERARAAAVDRARRAALEAAVAALPGPIDPAARKAVLQHPEAWTGAYRVLSSSSDGAAVDVEIEVEIDLARLEKRLEPRIDGGDTPGWVLGRVSLPPPCTDDLGEHLRQELRSLEVIREGKAGPALQIQLTCAPLGGVPHTHLRMAKLSIQLWQGNRPWLQWHETGAGRDDATAFVDAVQRAAEHTAEQLARRGAKTVELRIVNPWPTERVRRLERLMRDRVRDVRAIDVAAVDSAGAVRLHVRGPADAQRFARDLEALSLPGFSLTITEIDATGTLTIRFQDHTADAG